MSINIDIIWFYAVLDRFSKFRIIIGLFWSIDYVKTLINSYKQFV